MDDGAPSKNDSTATNTTELVPEAASNLLLIPMYTPFLLWRERDQTEHPQTIVSIVQQHIGKSDPVR
jgi:hypothetical protein